MSYCLKNIQGTFGICGLKAGHLGPCRSYTAANTTTRHPNPSQVVDHQTEQEAVSRLRSFSDNPLITEPAVREFHTYMSLGESVESAYQGAFMFMVRRAG